MNRSCREVMPILAIAGLLVSFTPLLADAQAGTAAAAPASAPVMEAKISTNLSTKNGKVGATITAKTERSYKLQDGTDLPKGSRLIGTVSEVQSKKAGNGDSMLTFRFDQVEPKGGAAIPIHGMVVAIGPNLGPQESLGMNPVMGRGGVGSNPGLDPNAGLGKAGAKDEDDIPMGSTMPGVALGRHMDADWTTALKGIKTDIDLDSNVVIKVQLK